jgi:hypothetical protein
VIGCARTIALRVHHGAHQSDLGRIIRLLAAGWSPVDGPVRDRCAWERCHQPQQHAQSEKPANGISHHLPPPFFCWDRRGPPHVPSQDCLCLPLRRARGRRRDRFRDPPRSVSLPRGRESSPTRVFRRSLSPARGTPNNDPHAWTVPHLIFCGLVRRTRRSASGHVLLRRRCEQHLERGTQSISPACRAATNPVLARGERRHEWIG